MKRADSLRRKKDFRYTYRAGKSSGGRLCSMVYARNHNQPPKIGFSVSKKIGNSVTRNRAKRRMREALTPLIPSIKGGVNIISQDIRQRLFEHQCRRVNPDQAASLSAAECFSLRASLYLPPEREGDF